MSTRGVVMAAALAAALTGCGVASSGGSRVVQLSVTEHYGTRPLAQATRTLQGGHATVLDLVAGAGRVRTTPAGAIVAIGGRSGGWTVYINGIMRVGDVAHAQVHPGDRVWLDSHPPGAARRTRAVVGSFPEPFLHGRSGKRLPVRVECAAPAAPACAEVSQRLTAAGALAARGGLQMSFTQHTLRVLVGPWSALRGDEAAARLGADPAASGVYARFTAGGRTLALLDARGAPARTLGARSGLVAATRIADEQPVWLVTGTDGAGVLQAARALDESSLLGRYALAVHADIGIPLPVRTTPPRGRPVR